MSKADRVQFNNILDEVEKTKNKDVSILRYFPDVHMGYGHKGLSEIADKAGVSISKQPVGEYLIFVNKAQTALKLYARGGVIAHLKMPGTQKINPRTIRLIPRFFNGSEINYNAALNAAIKKYYQD